MPDGIARLWFIPAEGIDRIVITSDIQRYLGNDATVRPGVGTDGEYEGVDGYWIKALRTLTSYQVEDLRTASARWRHEQQQRRGGANISYVGSNTYHHQGGGRTAGRGGDSPVTTDAGYGGNIAGRREHPRMDPRMADPRMTDPRMLDGRTGPPPPVRGDEMDVDYPPPPARRHDDNRGFGQDRPPFQDGRPQYPDQNAYRGPPGPYGYGIESRDAREMWDSRDMRDPRVDPRADPRMEHRVDPRADPRMEHRVDPRADPRLEHRVDPRMDQRGPHQYSMGAPGPNYPRQQDPAYYPPGTGAYGGPPMSAAMQPPYVPNGYGPSPGQAPRDTGREPRYGGPHGGPPPGYSNDLRSDPRNAEARYAYPSPPVTVVDARDTTPNTVPPSAYTPTTAQGQGPAQPRYDYDGRPQPPQGVSYPPGPPQPGNFALGNTAGPTRGQNQGQRPLVTNDLGPETRRRRIN